MFTTLRINYDLYKYATKQDLTWCACLLIVNNRAINYNNKKAIVMQL